jgi:hypothetical protein
MTCARGNPPDAAGESLPRLGYPADDRPGQGLRMARFGEQIIRPPPCG